MSSVNLDVSHHSHPTLLMRSLYVAEYVNYRNNVKGLRADVPLQL